MRGYGNSPLPLLSVLIPSLLVSAGCSIFKLMSHEELLNALENAGLFVWERMI